MRNILVIADVASGFGGNFCESMHALQTRVKEKGCQIVFAFPQRASSTSWANSFDDVRFFEWNVNSLKQMIRSVTQGGVAHLLQLYRYHKTFDGTAC